MGFQPMLAGPSTLTKLTKEEFELAAKRGQGRALIAARSGAFKPSFNLMRRLAMRWHGFDAQGEERRSTYLAFLLDATGRADQVLSCLLVSLQAGKGQGHDRSQRLNLAVHYGRIGHEGARRVLYALGIPEADRIIEMDGLAGLKWVWERNGSEVDPFEFIGWVNDAREIDGEAVDDWLAANPEAEKLTHWKRDPANHLPTQPKTLEAFRVEWKTDQRRTRGLLWGRYAEEAEMKKAAAELLTSDDEAWIRTLGGAFRRRGDLLDIPSLIARWREVPLDQESPWQHVLRYATHPSLREFGLELLPFNIEAALDLLKENALPEDVPTVEESLRKLNTGEDIVVHSVGMSAESLARRMPEASSLLAWVYENTPCSFCRSTAFEMLIKTGLATPSMIEECLYDCESWTRELAQGCGVDQP